MAIKDRYTAKPMGAAYQGAMESVFSIVIAVLLGWWADSSFDTSPWGVLAGATIGFGAFVLRLTRLGKHMNAPPEDPEVGASLAESAEASPEESAEETETNDRPR